MHYFVMKSITTRKLEITNFCNVFMIMYQASFTHTSCSNVMAVK